MVITYTMIGGFRAVVATNIMQLAVVLSVFTAAVFLLKLKPVLPMTIKSFLAYDARFDTADWSHLGALFFLPLGYCLVGQDLAQRFFCARGPRTASLAALVAALVVVIFALMPVLIGFDVRLSSNYTPMSDYLLLDYVKTRLDPFFYYLLVCAVIAAISSTADAALCALGSSITEDFSLSTILPYSRALILFVGLSALIIAYQFDDILSVLSLSYELSVSVVLVPFLCAVLLKQPKLTAAVFSMLFGLAGFLIIRFLPIYPLKELFACGLSLIGYIFAHLRRT